MLEVHKITKIITICLSVQLVKENVLLFWNNYHRKSLENMYILTQRTFAGSNCSVKHLCVSQRSIRNTCIKSFPILYISSQQRCLLHNCFIIRDQHKNLEVNSLHVRDPNGCTFHCLLLCWCYFSLHECRYCHQSSTSGIWKDIHFFFFSFERLASRLTCRMLFHMYSTVIYLLAFYLYQKHKVEYHIKVCISYSGDMLFFFLIQKCPGVLNLFCIHLATGKRTL